MGRRLFDSDSAKKLICRKTQFSARPRNFAVSALPSRGGHCAAPPHSSAGTTDGAEDDGKDGDDNGVEDDDGNADRWHYYILLHCLHRFFLSSSAPSVVLRTLIEARGTVAAARGSRFDGKFLYNSTGNKQNVCSICWYSLVASNG